MKNQINFDDIKRLAQKLDKIKEKPKKKINIINYCRMIAHCRNCFDPVKG